MTPVRWPGQWGPHCPARPQGVRAPALDPAPGTRWRPLPSASSDGRGAGAGASAGGGADAVFGSRLVRRVCRTCTARSVLPYPSRGARRPGAGAYPATASAPPRVRFALLRPWIGLAQMSRMLGSRLLIYIQSQTAVFAMNSRGCTIFMFHRRSGLAITQSISVLLPYDVGVVFWCFA